METIRRSGDEVTPVGIDLSDQAFPIRPERRVGGILALPSPGTPNPATRNPAMKSFWV